MNKIEEKICTSCYKNNLKFIAGRYMLRCIPCSMKHSYNKKKSKQLEDPVFCAKCEKPFYKKMSLQKYCGDPCSSKPTRIESFINKKSRKKTNAGFGGSKSDRDIKIYGS